MNATQNMPKMSARRDGTFVMQHEDKRPEAKVYRDVLGVPQPRAHVSGWGGSYGNYTHYSVSSTAHDVRVGPFPSPEAAEAALAADGWTVVERKSDGYGKPVLVLEHGPTKAAADALEARVRDKWKNAEPCFVHYGKLPPGGRSKNHVGGTLEAGVSVYHGQRLPSGEARPLPKTNQEFAGALQFHREGAPLYIVTGEPIGIGPDGEPLLRNAKIVQRAKA